jgi:hypothetical protein
MPFTQLAIAERWEKHWWCVSCVAEIDLDTQGRCGACWSDAVDRSGRSTFLTSACPASEASTLAYRASGRLNLLIQRRLQGIATRAL